MKYIFKDFLNKEEVLEEFLRNARKVGIEGDVSFRAVIHQLFDWRETPEGWKFWSVMDTRWLEFSEGALYTYIATKELLDFLECQTPKDSDGEDIQGIESFTLEYIKDGRRYKITQPNIKVLWDVVIKKQIKDEE